MLGTGTWKYNNKKELDIFHAGLLHEMYFIEKTQVHRPNGSLNETRRVLSSLENC